MRHCAADRRRSISGFSNQQALLAILVAFPLGLIALGLILNMLKEPSQHQPSAPPTAKQGQSENPRTNNSSSQKTGSAASISDNSVLDLGAAVDGTPIRLLLKSIRHGEGNTHTFTYRLGDATIEAMANCDNRTWISYPERQLNRPQSPATEQMLIHVCDGIAERDLPEVAIVHDPPSNIRVTPAGSFLCTINSKRTIRVGQLVGEWYPTSVCGREGFIHRSQLQF